MEFKANLQGYLIYAAMLLYLLAFGLTLARRKKAGHIFYLLGFLVVLAAFLYRWNHVDHVPLQNMFEIFLSLGMIYPVSLFCRKALRIGAEAADMLLGVIVLFPAGFIFNANPQNLPPALQSWLFAPHVAVYVLSYILMAKAAVQAAAQFLKPGGPDNPELVDYDRAAYRMVCLGFPLLTLGLILGSYWGKLAWGDFWGWDPKESWSLVTWLVYLIYLHFRSMYGRKFPRINSLLILLGLLAVLITLLWVNLARIFAGLHSYAA